MGQSRKTSLVRINELHESVRLGDILEKFMPEGGNSVCQPEEGPSSREEKQVGQGGWIEQ